MGRSCCSAGIVDVTPIAKLIKAGADLKLDILPAITATVAVEGQPSIPRWNLDWIIDEIRRNTQARGEPDPLPPPAPRKSLQARASATPAPSERRSADVRPAAATVAGDVNWDARRLAAIGKKLGLGPGNVGLTVLGIGGGGRKGEAGDRDGHDRAGWRHGDREGLGRLYFIDDANGQISGEPQGRTFARTQRRPLRSLPRAPYPSKGVAPPRRR